jgi:hypothetical protein
MAIRLSQGNWRSRGGASLLFAGAFLALVSAACKPQPLTAEKVESLLRGKILEREPVYAEVPQRVTYGPKSPEDDFDMKSVATLRNLERAGYITVSQSTEPDGTVTFLAKATQKGFPLLGTLPSYRGPVYRAKICEKQFDGIRNFIRHPNDPTVGRAEIVWHYDRPTSLYPLYETKINKPLNKPFATLVSIHWENHEWKTEVIVRKTDSE